MSDSHLFGSKSHFSDIVLTMQRVHQLFQGAAIISKFLSFAPHRRPLSLNILNTWLRKVCSRRIRKHALGVKRAKVPHLRSRLNGSIPSPSHEGAEEATVPSKPTELSTVWGRLLCATVRVNRRLARFFEKEKASALYCAKKINKYLQVVTRYQLVHILW